MATKLSRKSKKKPLEPPQESNPETRKYGPYSSPGVGDTFNIYTTDFKYKLSDFSQSGHVKVYDDLIRKRIAELDEENAVTPPILTEALAHKLMVTSEHEVKKMVTMLTDPTRHNPWSVAADTTKDNKRVTSIRLRYIDL